jgi:hypothetical protein
VKRRAAHIFPKASDGFYVEPEWVSRRLFEEEKFGIEVYDPACGWGTILTEARRAGYLVFGSDIVDRRRHGLTDGAFLRQDFLAEEWSRVVAPPDASIVCNPPFDHVEEFCRRALEISTAKVAMICLVRRLNAAHWLRELPLRRIWLLTPRPSMPPGKWIAAGNKPGGGTQDFVWLVFERGYDGKAEIDWLCRDAEQMREAAE